MLFYTVIIYFEIKLNCDIITIKNNQVVMLVNKIGGQQLSTPFNVSSANTSNGLSVNDLGSKIINKCASAAEIISSDALKYTFGYLNSKDLPIIRLVSKFWGHTTIEFTRDKEVASLRSFVRFLVKNLGSMELETQYKLLQLTEKSTLSNLNSLIEIKGFLLDSRNKIEINIKNSLEKEIKLCRLESLIKNVDLEDKPTFFDNIIILSAIEVWCDLAKSSTGSGMQWNYLQQAVYLCLSIMDFERATKLAKEMGMFNEDLLAEIQAKREIANKQPFARPAGR